MFKPLRLAAKRSPDMTAIRAANDAIISSYPPLPTGAFNNPGGRALSDGSLFPNWTVGTNTVDVAYANRILRNGDDPAIRQVYSASNNEVEAIRTLRGNAIPDAKLFNIRKTQADLRTVHPNLNTKTAEGVNAALTANPRLATYLKGLGTVVLVGAGVYLVLKGIDLISDIIEALNRTGGSHVLESDMETGEVTSCILRWRSCGVDWDSVPNDKRCPYSDPLLTVQEELDNICVGYNLKDEGSVCRKSDPDADPETLQYVDVDELLENRQLTCIEPYNLADLIGDLGLGWLLGPDNVAKQSSNMFAGMSTDFIKPLLNLILYVVLILAAVVASIYAFRYFSRRSKAADNSHI